MPYANATLHLGHLRSTYIPADIYARYLRLKGCDVAYICATDEYGTPIAIRAETEGITPKEVVDKYHKLIHSDLKKIGCSFEIFGRTTFATHRELTQEFFKRLVDNGYIYKTKYLQPYCQKCKRFLPDRYVEGTCPHCGSNRARGDACEACGRYLKPTELKSPRCSVCGSTPEIRETEHWFFKLSAFQEFLSGWIKDNKELPANVKNYALNWVVEGLKDWCITRDMAWGVPVPLAEAKNKVIYVWFDAPIGYISSTKRWSERIGKPSLWEDYWKKEDCKIVHFIGKDIIYHHAIFWPAMLKAHGKYRLPDVVSAGEYLTLEGEKMSKSRQWVVNVADYLEKFDPDPLRYYLVAVAPLDRDADFSWDEYGRKNNDELADILGNFIHRTLTFVGRFFEMKTPKPHTFEAADKRILQAIKDTHSKVDKELEQLNFNVALRSIVDLAALGNQYLNEKQPWKTIETKKEDAATTLYIACQIVKALSIMLEPFLPNTAEKIWTYLNLAGSVHKKNWNEALKELKQGHKLKEPKPLFTKIEKKTIDEQKSLLSKGKLGSA